jgi:hypothetical protein
MMNRSYPQVVFLSLYRFTRNVYAELGRKFLEGTILSCPYEILVAIGCRGTAMPIGVNLSPGKWNSRLYKQSSPTVTNENSRVLKPAQAGFVCIAAVLTAQLT